jgi:hypothetical protein
MMNEAGDTQMTKDALAQLGGPNIVYVRSVKYGEIRDELDDVEMPDLPNDAILYSVHAADGTRVALMDDRDAAFVAARQHEMEPVSVH